MMSDTRRYSDVLTLFKQYITRVSFVSQRTVSPLVQFAVYNILRLISRCSSRKIQEMRQELFRHVVQKFVGYTKSLTRASWSNTHHL